jgi:hypothetical protein
MPNRVILCASSAAIDHTSGLDLLLVLGRPVLGRDLGFLAADLGRSPRSVDSRPR